jgi:hypothetical protein
MWPNPVTFEFTRLDGSTCREVVADPEEIFDHIKRLGAVTARAVNTKDNLNEH